MRLPNGVLGEQHVPQITAEFEETYRGLYGRKGPDVALEIINWRVVASGRRPEMNLHLPRGTSDRSDARKGSRLLIFASPADSSRLLCMIDTLSKQG